MKKFMGNLTGKVKGFVLNHSTLVAAVTFAFVIMDCNSTCCFLEHQPELPKGCEKLKKYV